MSQSGFKIPTDCLLFPCFPFFSFFSFLAFLCASVSTFLPLSLPWYSRIWRPCAFRERWELDKGCVKRVFLGLNMWDPPQKLPRGSLSLGRADRLPFDAWHTSFHPDENHNSFHPDISHPESSPPTLHPPEYITSGIQSPDIPSTQISYIRNPVCRHSIYPDISHPESCPLTFHPPGYLTSGILSTDIPSTRISHIRNPVHWHSIHQDISHSKPCRRIGDEDDSTSPGRHVRILGNAYPECVLDLSAIPTLSS